MMGRHAPAMRSSGSSILEAVMVAAVLAVVLTLAAGGGSLRDERRLAAAARAVATDIRVAEGRARAERRCLRVRFDRTEDVYTMVRYAGRVTAGGAGPCADALAWSGEPVFKESAGDTVSRRMPAGIDLVSTTFAADTLHVSPLGNTSAGTIVIRNARRAGRRVIVEVTGRVTVAR